MPANFLNLHLLFTTSVANMNRDDTGAPKQVTWGGVTRHRASSQAMTRPKRLMFEQAAPGERATWRAKGGMVDLAVAKIADLAAETGTPLTNDEIEAATTAAGTAITSLVQNKDKAQKEAEERARKKAAQTAKKAADAAAAGEEAVEQAPDNGTGKRMDDSGPKDTLVWLAEHELNDLAAKVVANIRGNVPLTDFVNNRGRTQSLTIAAFGRMFAFRPDLQNEAAIQRSHAFTTHGADIEPDYFTAVDDLPSEAQGSGAGHLDIAQYGGGVFYWHCNIDRRQLWNTWIAPTDPTAERTQLVDLVTALLLAQPNGKQTTAASKTVPDAVLAVPAAAPIALHQAFEKPVTAKAYGHRQPSVDRLLTEHAKTVTFTPRQFPAGAHYAGTVTATNPGLVTSHASLDDLIDLVVDWILAGKPGTATEAA